MLPSCLMRLLITYSIQLHLMLPQPSPDNSGWGFHSGCIHNPIGKARNRHNLRESTEKVVYNSCPRFLKKPLCSALRLCIHLLQNHQAGFLATPSCCTQHLIRHPQPQNGFQGCVGGSVTLLAMFSYFFADTHLWSLLEKKLTDSTHSYVIRKNVSHHHNALLGRCYRALTSTNLYPSKVLESSNVSLS